MAAKRLLRNRSDIMVTVVNPRPHFVQRIRLHQMIAAGYDATVSFDRALLRTAYRVSGTMTDIDAAVSRLTLDDGIVLDNDVRQGESLFVHARLGDRAAPLSLLQLDVSIVGHVRSQIRSKADAVCRTYGGRIRSS